jgi:uncharacterized protein (TIGR03067 family)
VKLKKKRSEQELRATAFHEAGHAIVELALGLTVTKVSIIACEDYYGSVDGPGPAGYEDGNACERKNTGKLQIIGCYAGMPAERLIDPDAPDVHGVSDEDQAITVANSRGNRLNHLARYRKDAEKLVKTHRNAIEAFAKLLLLRLELEQAEIEEFWENFQIDGKWKVVEMQLNGRKLTKADECSDTWYFSNDSLLRSDESKGSGKMYKVRIDAGKSPPHIDLTGPAERQNGAPLRGIYSIESDRLRICIRDASTKGGRPPEEFLDAAEEWAQPLRAGKIRAIC